MDRLNPDEADPLETFEQPKSAPSVPPLVVTAGLPVGYTETVTQAGTQAPGTVSLPGRTTAIFAPPGYEITGELGRGGMGVVYQARQSSLKRLVALKMIRDAGAASFEQISRFRVEAEAVARLQHPNIVQIFEVGEHEGNPFFALEYVDGGSMAAALADRAWSPEESAGLVETLARALHHAHQRDVIHRDLKPANVLLSAERVPKVTDFGLAKRLEDGDSGHTRTGAVMGTPSYMSPEQASGRIHQIGPATDIYALGAILYECLTGEVPFRGESVLDTLELVRSADPKAPSKIRPGIPADLETICLKTMAKEPSARYSSALALAQDLERFRSGEPILGRREGTLRKLRRRFKRHQAPVIAVSALLIAVVAIAVTLFAGRSSREARVIEQQITDALDGEIREPAAGDRIEEAVGRLAELDAVRGATARQRLVEHFAAEIRADLKKPRVLAGEAPGLENRLAWLASRDPAAAGELGDNLRARLRTWQPLFDLEEPFANLRELFDPSMVRSDVDRIYANQPVAITKLADAGTLRVEVDFQGDWPKSNELGILFAHRIDGPRDHTNGYAFVLRPAWPKGDPEAAGRPGLPSSFEASRRAATLEILRDGVPLGLAPLHVRSGPVRLTAERVGERLSIQLNGLTTFVFEDPAPLAFDAGARLALLWPRDVSVRHLYAEEQPLPPLAGKLERADHLFATGKTADALNTYQAFAREEADSETLAEARHKAGMCLLALDRAEEAARLFEEVSTAGNQRWGVSAAFQLWRTRLKLRQIQEADAVLSLIRVRYPGDAINRYVPVSIRAEIEAQFAIPPINWLMFDPRLVPQMESAVRLAEVLQLKNRSADREALMLVMALGLAGEYRKARAIADQYFDALVEIGHLRGGAESPHWAARAHAWSGRLSGQVGSYNDQIARHLDVPLRDGEDPESRRRAFVPLRLENARNLAFTGDWAGAEAELDAYVAAYPRPVINYAFYSEPYFMKGFARLRAGDAAGAGAAWKTGTYAAFLEGIAPESRPADGIPGSRKALAEAWAMAALSNNLSDEEATRFFKGLSKSFGADEVAAQVAASLNISPVIMRGAWISPRGREWARKMAYLDLAPAEYFWTGPRLLVYEKFRQELADAKPSPEQDEAFWQATVQTCEAFRLGELTRPQLFELALAWKGTTNLLGWSGLAPKLKPELRAPMAYVLGCRYLKLGKPADAAAAFKMAAGDAPAGSSLRTLAEAALKTPK